MAGVPANPYLQRILNARVYDVAIETPLDLAPLLSARLGAKVLLKREDLQPVFSFKLRGAYNKMVNLPAAACAAGSSQPAPATTPRAWRSRRASWVRAPSSSCRRRHPR